MNEFDMFLALLDYANKNELYDTFEELELEWQNINKENIDKWRSKVKKIYNKLKEKGFIKWNCMNVIYVEIDIIKK